MREPGYFAERDCIKKRHRSERTARKHLRLLIEGGDAKKGDLNVYLCPDCKFYHVGHIKFNELRIGDRRIIKNKKRARATRFDRGAELE
jgi:hypothetical protein